MIEALIRYQGQALQNMFNIKGRSCRKQLVYVLVSDIVIGAILGVILGTLSRVVIKLFGILGVGISIVLGIAAGIFGLFAITIPLFTLCIRRLHDSNKSGWYMLIGLIPWIGEIVLLVIMLMHDSLPANKWGHPDNPHSPESGDGMYNYKGELTGNGGFNADGSCDIQDHNNSRFV